MPHVERTENIIEVENVSFAFGEVDVLKDISFEVHKGDYLGMIGPNGSGKTTLLKIMLGLMEPSKGSVRLFGTDVHNFRQWSKIGYVPQKAVAFDVNFPATVHEVVLMGR
ncbi:MAG TPA: ATP-binding cassette domain-containing protein, partial [Patescibacteria group bacterium]|nr:ATP-binding cassette domain-containing protein [Patescibacteria group bacterium]